MYVAFFARRAAFLLMSMLFMPFVPCALGLWCTFFFLMLSSWCSLSCPPLAFCPSFRFSLSFCFFGSCWFVVVCVVPVCRPGLLGDETAGGHPLPLSYLLALW